MKRTGSYLFVIFLIAVYCFAIGVVTKTLVRFDIQTTPTNEQEECFSTFSISLFNHTSQSESSVTSFSNLPAPSFKNPFNEFGVICRTTQQLLETEFSQYTIIAINFLILYRKTDIIFPFHYFW